MLAPVLDEQVFAFLLPYLPLDVFKVLRAASFAVGKVACEAMSSLVARSHKSIGHSRLDAPQVPSLKEEWEAEQKANEFSLTAGAPS